MNCTCFDLTLEQAANGGLMQAAANCTHKEGGVMSLEERLREILEDICIFTANAYGGFEGFDPDDVEHTENAIADILQAITDAGYVHQGETDGITVEKMDSETITMSGTEWLERFENELSNLPTSHPKLDNIHRESDILEAAIKASKL